MRVIIELRVEDEPSGVGGPELVVVAEWRRRDHSMADPGMTLAEGRDLLANVQSALVRQQAASWTTAHAACERCCSALAHKDNRSLMLRTVFGKVSVPSPRFWACACRARHDEPHRTVSPMCTALPRRVTSELQYLQARWAAHLPYRQATELLREVLPLDKTISMGSTRRRVLAVGKALDAEIEREIAARPKVAGTADVR